MYGGVHIKCPLFLPDLSETQIFGKNSNVKFHENPSSGNGFVPCGGGDGSTDEHDEANSYHHHHVPEGLGVFPVP